jgi:ATP-dependent DNA helicase RecQ
MSPKTPDVRAALKRYFGFDTFRPLQEQIICDALAGKDVFALLPTGGGKSLCFQLPALVRPGLTVVVSPLIALMKDQVDALQASGVAATFLNSSISSSEARERLAKLHHNQYKLLYMAPERMMLPGFLEKLKQWNVQLLAIDEAHCISEWGHDFRPEYRQLAQIRKTFPTTPVMALTATATERVRTDIVTQLKLREASVYVASFNRPNLTYRVFPKSDPYEQLLQFISSRPKDSGIVYCHSRKGAESTAAKLNGDRVSARAYHAGLEGKERAKNQEAFLRDEVRVICATIAFGMGINKPNVRFVVHYDLPKNIESYYQETGRAGRDGLPSECALFFSAGDAVKQQRFIDEKPGEHERNIARAQLTEMVHYADCGECRRAALLQYFGETFPTDNCGACDNCLSPRATYDGTVAAQKLLSCVYRIREHSRFGVGLNHVVEVLTGSENEKVLKWGHQKLSTYGIGKELKRSEWLAAGRELMRLGLLKQDSAQFNVLQLTAEGCAALKERRKITLTKALAVAERKLSKQGDISCDETLFERLRTLRRRLAEERGVPPYIIFSDVTLRQVAREYPAAERDLKRISGMGEKKREEFGAMILEEVASHVAANPRQIFADDSFAPGKPREMREPPSRLSHTARETLEMFASGASVANIARKRELSEGTICSHLASAIASGEKVDTTTLLTAAEYQQMADAFAKHGSESLAPAKAAVGDRFDYPKLHIARALYETRKNGFS